MGNRHALLIGIDSHPLHGGSIGALDDVVDLWRVLLDLGYDPDNVRIAVSPGLDLDRLTGVRADRVTGATETEIRAGLTWLAQRQQGPNPTAFVHVSGNRRHPTRAGGR